MNFPINQILLGDAIEVLKTLPDNSVDALITDPPAGICFMSKSFDHHRGGMIDWVNWLSEIMAESLRVMKPGAIGLVWSIPRTCGWTQLALELAGFRVIDSIAILNGSGFPKGLDISKAIDKLNECDREVVGTPSRPDGSYRNPLNGGNPGAVLDTIGNLNTNGSMGVVTAPNHPDAVKWDGWKSAQLKPSHEDWFIVQKPVEGTIARNVLKWGTGGVNISACRIETTESTERASGVNQGTYGKDDRKGMIRGSTTGRYPANTILICSHDCEGDTHSKSCPVSVLDEQGGERKSGGRKGFINGMGYHGADGADCQSPIESSTGTAARYFKQLPHDPETKNVCLCSLCSKPFSPKHDRMNAYVEVKKECVVLNVEAILRLIVDKKVSVQDPALASIQLGSGVNNLNSLTSALLAESNLKTFLETEQKEKALIALINAVASLSAKIVRNVKSAETLCDLCVIAIALSLAQATQGQTEQSPLSLVFMDEHEGQILSQCLAQYVEAMGNTGIITTTAALKILLGYVFHAMQNSTTKERSEALRQPVLSDSMKYQTKASQRDRSCDGAVDNIHPTVKNRSLMRYLCKLITPPGGVVLDPFGGSGSTAIGAIEEGFNYLLIEKEEEYHAIALARIAATLKALNVKQLALEVFQ